MSAIKIIIDSMKSELQPIMDIWVENQMISFNNLIQIKQSDEYQKTKYLDKFYYLTRNGYSKGQITLASMGGLKYALEYYIKQSVLKLNKIDKAVNLKLKDIVDDIDHVENQSVRTSGLDGYLEGNWVLYMKDGTKELFDYNTIYAGGYNIQCFHIRTKYYLKDLFKF